MNLLGMLSSTSDLTKTDTWLQMFNKHIWPYVTIALWVLVAVLAVVFIVKAVTTALAVMKAADEPQVRQEKLSSFKYLAIGLAVAIIVISLANVVVDLLLDNAVVDSISGTN